MLKIVIKGKLKSVVEQNSDEQVAEDPFKLGASVKNCDRFLSTASKITGLKLADPIQRVEQSHRSNKKRLS